MRSKSIGLAAAVALVYASQPVLAQMEEIVVTARKQQESLNDVPLSISAFTDAEFTKRNINNLGDVAQYTPGFSFESYAGGITPAPVIRGLSQTAIQGRVQNVSVFIDGIYIQQQGNVDFGLLGIERIEVVKGPQSALYGRNSFAGAINYVTKKPSEEFTGTLTGTLGTDERKDAKIEVSGPIIPEMLFGRITVGTTEFDGTWENRFDVTNTNTGQRFTDDAIKFEYGEGTDGNLGGYDNESVAVALRFRPLDMLEFNLNYYDMEIRNDEGAIGTLEPTNDPTAIAPLNCSPNGNGVNQLYCGELDYDTDDLIRDPRNIGNYADSEIWSFETAINFTDRLTARMLLGKTRLQSRSFGAGDGATRIQQTGTGIFAQQPFVELESTSQELRLEYNAESLRLQAGMYATQVEDINFFQFYCTAKIAGAPASANDPSQTDVTSLVDIPGFCPGGTRTISDEAFEDDVIAFFGGIEKDFGSEWTVGLEARYTEEEKDFQDFTDATNNNEDTFYYFTPRATVDWKPDSDSLYYFTVAKGVKAGGFNSATADPGFESFDEESNWTWELGSKLTLLDGKLQLNTALFYVDWKDLQLQLQDVVPSQPGGALEGSYTGNADGATSLGLEVGGTLAITSQLRLNFAGSYTKAEFEDALESSLGSTCDPALCDIVQVELDPSLNLPPLTAADISGNKLPRTPEKQATVGLEFNQPILGMDFTARLDLSYQSEFEATALNLATIESRTLLNGSIVLAQSEQGWTVNLWGKNLTDEEYISNSFITGNPRRYIANFGDARTLGVTASYSW